MEMLQEYTYATLSATCLLNHNPNKSKKYYGTSGQIPGIN